MRNHEIAHRDALVAEQQDVDVDHARSPAPRPCTPAFALDLFGGFPQLSWRAGPLTFNDLVEDTGLISDSPRLGLDDAAFTPDTDAIFTPPPSGSRDVPPPPSDVP